MFFRAVTTPLMTPVPNFNKWCAVSNFLFKNIDLCIFTPKTPLVKENYFLTLWNFTYLKDTSFGKKLCNFELGLETKMSLKSGLFITLFQCIFSKTEEKNAIVELIEYKIYACTCCCMLVSIYRDAYRIACIAICIVSDDSRIVTALRKKRILTNLQHFELSQFSIIAIFNNGW